jgi:hypothetical protein
MRQEKYQPAPEEIKKALDAMTPEEKALSEAREKSFESRETKGLQPINPKTIDSDLELKEFLSNANVSRSKKGDGVFISGARGTDTSKFRKYGISVPGCLIIPTKEDAMLEVDRISMLVNTLRQEIQEKERKTYQQKQELETQEKERVAKETKEKLIAEYQKACEEFPGLGLRIEDGQYHQKLIDSEGRAVWGLNYTIEGYLREGGKGANNFREAAKIETEIRDFRNKNLQRVIDLNDLALKNNVRKISPKNWEGEEAGQYSQNQSDYFAVSHALYFDKYYEWTESDIDELEQCIKNKVEEVGAKNQVGFEELKKKKIAGASVELKHSELMIDGQSIGFATAENAQEAETWALENGAFLPYHYALGEKFRDRAKSEKWGERKSRIALAILDGAIPEIKTYTYTAKRPDRKGGGKYTASDKDLFVGDFHLGYGAGDFDDPVNESRFAIQFFIETNPTKAGITPPNLDTASREVLETYVKKLHEEKKSQKELTHVAETKKVETRAIEAGAKYGYEFIGVRDRGGVKEFGFIIDRGTAGRRVRQRLKDPNMLSGKLSSGWSIWVKEEDLGDLRKFFVQPEESIKAPKTSSEKPPEKTTDSEPFNNPFQDFFKK